MYVCICHAFTDKQVRKALDCGARTAAGVYASMGCAPQCGKCVPMVRDMVRGHRAACSAGAAQAGGAPEAQPQASDALLMAAE